MQTRTVKLDNQLDSQLLQFIKMTGKNRSDVLREALELYLAQQQAPKLSVYAQIKKYSGIITGPTDLSCNKKHLKGFGE